MRYWVVYAQRWTEINHECPWVAGPYETRKLAEEMAPAILALHGYGRHVQPRHFVWGADELRNWPIAREAFKRMGLEP